MILFAKASILKSYKITQWPKETLGKFGGERKVEKQEKVDRAKLS